MSSSDWSVCILCQKNLPLEKLRRPEINNRSDKNAGYETLAHNIENLNSLSKLPYSININRLKEDGLSIRDTFILRKPIWHYSCGSKLSTKEINRAKKRKLEDSYLESDTQESLVEFMNYEEPRQTRSIAPIIQFQNICFFCDGINDNDNEQLCTVSTKQTEDKIIKCINQMGNNILIAKITEGDMIAKERKYHPSCLVALYNSTRPFSSPIKSTLENTIEGIGYSEIISYICDIRTTLENPVFKMPMLVKRYEKRLHELAKQHSLEDANWNVHSSRLRAKLLNHFDDMIEIKVGREFLLTVKETVNHSVQMVADTYDDALIVSKVAKLIRNCLLTDKQEFNGKFEKRCQENSVDPMLFFLISNIGEKCCQALRGFHALSGCDTVSFFAGRGKLTFFNRWKLYPAATEALIFLSKPQTVIPEEIIQIIEKFVVICYLATSHEESVNEARKDLFAKQRSIENIPPTNSALKQHILRAAYTAGHLWGQALNASPILPAIDNWGWSEVDGKYQPFWSDQPEVSLALREFIQCNCKKGCKDGYCSCRKNQLNCTLMCKGCKGICNTP